MLHYFKSHLPNGFYSLFVAKTLNVTAAGLLGIFIPVFIYELFDNNILIVFAWFALASVLTLITKPFGVTFLNTIGFRRSLQISSVIGVLYYVLYFFTEHNPQHAVGLMLAITATLVLWRLFYWLPYHITFTTLSAENDRGKQVSIVFAIAQLTSAVMPIIAGFVLLHYSYSYLFVAAMILFALSIIPYRNIPESHEKYEWGYWESWKQLFSKENRGVVIPFMGMGAENTAGVLIWPIFIYELLEGNYFEVGALTTLIVGVTMLAQLLVGKRLDDAHLEKSFIKYGTTLNSLGWIVKAFVATAFHIFVAGLFHSLVKVITMTPLTTLMYEVGADQGHYIDEYTVLHDQAMHIGRLFMLGIASLLVVFISLQWAFIIAAFASLTFNIFASAKVSLRGVG